MTSKERVAAALNHKQPDRVPVDFGGTAVTGIHVSCVAALRDHFGLEKRPVKVHEPYQMLGWIDEDLKQALGIDVDGVFPPRTMFGFPTDDWKPWRTPHGLEVLVPGNFNTRVDANGDTLIYPEGDLSARPSGRMPKDGYFFDTIIRQEPIDEDKLDPEDNLEEFGPISDADLAHFKAGVDALRRLGPGGDRDFRRHGVRRHRAGARAVPEESPGHPRRGRVVHVDGLAPRLRPPDLRAAVRDRAGQPGEDPRRRRQRGGRGLPVRHRLRHADVGVLLGGDVPRSVLPLLPAHQRLDPPQHDLEVLQALLRLGGAVHPVVHRGRLRHPEPGAVLGRRHGRRDI